MDYVRLRLLQLLSEQPGVQTTVANDYFGIDLLQAVQARDGDSGPSERIQNRQEVRRWSIRVLGGEKNALLRDREAGY